MPRLYPYQIATLAATRMHTVYLLRVVTGSIGTALIFRHVFQTRKSSARSFRVVLSVSHASAAHVVTTATCDEADRLARDFADTGELPFNAAFLRDLPT